MPLLHILITIFLAAIVLAALFKFVACWITGPLLNAIGFFFGVILIIVILIVTGFMPASLI